MAIILLNLQENIGEFRSIVRIYIFSVHITSPSKLLNQLLTFQVQECLKLALDRWSPDIIWKLRHLNEGYPEICRSFWNAVQEYIEEQQLIARDDRRHEQTCHMVLAYLAW